MLKYLPISDIKNGIVIFSFPAPKADDILYKKFSNCGGNLAVEDAKCDFSHVLMLYSLAKSLEGFFKKSPADDLKTKFTSEITSSVSKNHFIMKIKTSTAISAIRKILTIIHKKLDVRIALAMAKNANTLYNRECKLSADSLIAAATDVDKWIKKTQILVAGRVNLSEDHIKAFSELCVVGGDSQATVKSPEIELSSKLNAMVLHQYALSKNLIGVVVGSTFYPMMSSDKWDSVKAKIRGEPLKKYIDSKFKMDNLRDVLLTQALVYADYYTVADYMSFPKTINPKDFYAII
jgi:hypothetical protein